MKIVLIDKNSGCYLSEGNFETRDLSAAMNFETQQAAQRYCRQNRLMGVKIVAKFPERTLHDVLLGEC